MRIAKDTVIVGHSGFAKEIRWLLESVNKQEVSYRFLGYIDEISGEDVLGGDKWVYEYSKPLQVVIAIGNGVVRQKLVLQYKKNPNITFPNIIDPSVRYDASLQMGEGNIICANNILTTDIKIGSFNIFNLNSTIGHECIIEDFVTINPGCNISGNVRIGSKCLVGTGATILQMKTIGENATIGAGAVVIRDIASETINVGVPAKEVKK